MRSRGHPGQPKAAPRTERQCSVSRSTETTAGRRSDIDVPRDGDVRRRGHRRPNPRPLSFRATRGRGDHGRAGARDAVPCRASSVGDEEAGPPRRRRSMASTIDASVVTSGTRRLVEDEDRRILEEGAGERDPLTFTTGQAHAALADGGLVPQRQGLDELVGAGHARCPAMSTRSRPRGHRRCSRRSSWRRGPAPGARSRTGSAGRPPRSREGRSRQARSGHASGRRTASAGSGSSSSRPRWHRGRRPGCPAGFSNETSSSASGPSA